MSSTYQRVIDVGAVTGRLADDGRHLVKRTEEGWVAGLVGEGRVKMRGVSQLMLVVMGVIRVVT